MENTINTIKAIGQAVKLAWRFLWFGLISIFWVGFASVCFDISHLMFWLLWGILTSILVSLAYDKDKEKAERPKNEDGLIYETQEESERVLREIRQSIKPETDKTELQEAIEWLNINHRSFNHKTQEDRREIPELSKKIAFVRSNGRCVKCGTNESLQYDHILPYSKGGNDNPENVQLLCAKCNRRKSDKIV